MADRFENTEHLNVTSSPDKRFFEYPLILTLGGPLRADDDSDGIIVPFKQLRFSETAFRLCRTEDR